MVVVVLIASGAAVCLKLLENIVRGQQYAFTPSALLTTHRSFPDAPPWNPATMATLGALGMRWIRKQCIIAIVIGPMHTHREPGAFTMLNYNNAHTL